MPAAWAHLVYRAEGINFRVRWRSSSALRSTQRPAVERFLRGRGRHLAESSNICTIYSRRLRGRPVHRDRLLEGQTLEQTFFESSSRHHALAGHPGIQISDALVPAHAQGHPAPRHQTGEHLHHQSRPGEILDFGARGRSRAAAGPDPLATMAAAGSGVSHDARGRGAGTIAYNRRNGRAVKTSMCAPTCSRSVVL